mmetsp:Transcript_26881/g.33623  ORF Transcript_26881/g.33623 Transcript_26881/m.33623 type:complete len:236 (-) Transcript_26881:151-858(-)
MNVSNKPEPEELLSGTWVMPTLQHRSIGIRNDEYITKGLLSNLGEESARGRGFLNLSTAYLNLTNSYKSLLRKRASGVNVLTAGPTAHGFAGAKGYKSFIPKAYLALERDIIHKCIQAHQYNSSTLYRYIRPGWTYHAKGLWIGYSQNKDDDSRLPNLSVIGSSNFGHRSVYRDLESQIVIISDDDEVRRDLRREWENLKLFSEKAVFLDDETHSPSYLSKSSRSQVIKLAQRFL